LHPSWFSSQHWRSEICFLHLWRKQILSPCWRSFLPFPLKLPLPLQGASALRIVQFNH
jgi:hypothetical protein